MITTIIGTVVIVIVTILVGRVIDKRLAPAPEELAGKPRTLPGEAPAAAIRARPAQLARLRAGQRCPNCRAAMRALPDEAIRYDEQSMLVLHFECPDCGRKRSLYAAPTTTRSS